MSSEILRIIGVLLLAVLPIYVIIIGLKYGEQKSISMSYYLFEPSKRWVFQVVVYLTAIGGGLSFQTILGSIASGLLFLVALFPTIEREGIDKPVHLFGAISSICLYFISTYIDFHTINAILAMLCFSTGIGIYRFFNTVEDTFIWDIEITAFILLLLTIIKQSGWIS